MLSLYIYRVSQEERSVFWEVIVSVILSSKVYMYVCISTEQVCLFVCFPGATTQCGCIFTAR
jgi:hypothetical protein